MGLAPRYSRHSVMKRSPGSAMKKIIAPGLGLVSLCAFATIVGGAELKIMSTIALKPVLTSVASNFEKLTGEKIELIWSESGKINADIEAGAPFDIAILTPNFVDVLVKQGKLNGATR